jgi:hypothetical protein
MIRNKYPVFYNYFRKFRELPIEGVFGKNKNEGANEKLLFLLGGYSEHYNGRRLNNG